MKMFVARWIRLWLLFSVTSGFADVAVNDPDGTLGATSAPVSAWVRLSRGERRAAAEGRLHLRELNSGGSQAAALVPLQLFQPTEAPGPTRICWLMPPGAKGERRFKLETVRHAPDKLVVAKRDIASGQFDLLDAGQPVLRYNYQTIEPGDLLTNVPPDAQRYARARSDYIHPLFGLDGQLLTQDWAKDHPHHRGIYWAWPEVQWHGQMADLHALQKVFARPTGNCRIQSGPVFAQLDAENLWKWEEGGESLVREQTIIRVYRTDGSQRIVDLEFRFEAVGDPVYLARRGQEHYGGLNLRFSRVEEQQILPYTHATNCSPRMAWGELCGRFGGAATPSGVVILQHAANPDYPGDWVQYAELNWLQPTFPASGTRYELKRGQPLVLRYRLWLYRGAKAGETDCAARWRAYQAAAAPKVF